MKRGLKILLTGGIVFVVWVLAAPMLASFLVVERPLPTADAIILLSGSPVYKERSSTAAEVYREGRAPRIFITDDGGKGGWSPADRRNLRFYELTKRELVSNGVPEDAVTLLPGKVSGTDDEARALASNSDQNPLQSVLIVTSPYHTRRSLRTFERIAAPRAINFGIVHTPIENEPSIWWLTSRGWETVGLEYVKSVVYWLKY